MIAHFGSVFWRQIRRSKIYTVINILGLAVGIGLSLALCLYVWDDYTFDRFHGDVGDIYRMVCLDTHENKKLSITPGPLMVAAEEEVPEVQAATRFLGLGQMLRRTQDESQEATENGLRVRVLVTDPGFFDVFGFGFIRGEASALDNDNAVFITPEVANWLFGEEDPIGRPLYLGYNPNEYVAGIVEKPPRNSHIQFDLVVPLRPSRNPLWWDSWENLLLSGYLRLRPGTDPRVAEEKIQAVAHSHGMPEIYKPCLQPMLDVHLGSSDHLYDHRNLGKNDASVVKALLAIAAMVLVIASINFINLASARAIRRAREVGMRKVVGSGRGRLVVQFLSESVFTVLIAMLVSVLLLQLLGPWLQNFLRKELGLNFLTHPRLLLLFLGTALFVGLLAGVYPAVVLSGYQPAQVLRGSFQSGSRGVRMRQCLVVFQFAMTIGLMLAILTVLYQIRYLKALNLGYDREVAVLGSGIRDGEDILKQRLSGDPGILDMGRIDFLPGSVFTRYEGIPEGKSRSESLMMQRFHADDGLLSVLGIRLLQGRNFSKEMGSDLECVLVNETAVRMSGWADPIGKRLDVIELEGQTLSFRVIGVVADVHYSQLRDKMEPMVFHYEPRAAGFLMMRFAGGSPVETKERVEKILLELRPDTRSRVFFLDDVFDDQFSRDFDFAVHMGFFAGIAIFIACLGLIGLVSYSVEQRRREMAVRKILGANPALITVLLMKDLLLWVVVANGLAWPVGYWAMRGWLDGFSYRMPFVLWPFFASGLAALAIAVLTISVQSLRAARVNPAPVLRQE